MAAEEDDKTWYVMISV